MGVSYNRLWKMLIDKNMKRIEMQYLTGISGNILARMGKNQYVSMETIEKICKKLDCTVDEMMEFTDDEQQEQTCQIIKTGRMRQKSKKEIEKREHAGYGINLLAKLRVHFYTGNSICLYRATCGVVPSFKKS